MIIKKEMEYVINETYGPEALPIANYLNGKRDISEFVIARDLKIEIHKVRQILYKLLEDNSVVFLRRKDKEKGWYICYWSMNDEEMPYIIRKIKTNKLNRLKERLIQETTEEFFMCKNACTRMNFDNAYELNFKCPDCGEIMNQQSNERTVEFLQKRIKELEIEVEKPVQALMHPDEDKIAKPLKTKTAKTTKDKKDIKPKKKTVKKVKENKKKPVKINKKSKKIKKKSIFSRKK